MSVTQAGNKHDVHHALKGPHRPREGDHEAVAQRLEELVERTRDKHEAHVGISELAGVLDQTSSLDRMSRYFKSLGCGFIPDSKQLQDEFVSWKMGNYIAVRNGKADEKFFESMPLYVRVGMHLLFYSSRNHSLLRYGSVEAMLKRMSEREGEIYDDDSKPDEVMAFIKNFIATYSIDTAQLVEQDLGKYPTRNSFFYRKLKPDARPIAQPDDPRVVASAADCRLMVFDSADEAKRIWIKGRHFSVKELINEAGKETNKLPEGSSIAIYRLAPADYHRYHHPVGPVTVIGKEHAGQEYYTVNPDAVNEDFDVYTGNTRDITMLDWTPEKGKAALKVAFVSIGALLVGANRFTNAEKGAEYKRGQEMGYFAYGGSTCIAIFPPEAKIRWDDDLMSNSQKSLETLVKVNERIGVSQA